MNSMPFQQILPYNSNIFTMELLQTYSRPVSQLPKSQQKHINKIAELAYKAGRLDGERKYKISYDSGKSKNVDIDDY